MTTWSLLLFKLLLFVVVVYNSASNWLPGLKLATCSRCVCLCVCVCMCVNRSTKQYNKSNRCHILLTFLVPYTECFVQPQMNAFRKQQQ